MERQSAAKTQKPSARSNHTRQSSGHASRQSNSLAQLQSSLGNQALQRLIQSSYIQTKLQVSTQGDPFEQEADRVADSVMRMADNPGATSTTQHVTIQRFTPVINRDFSKRGPEPEPIKSSPPLLQRRSAPVAVREDDDEEALAKMPDDSVVPEERPENLKDKSEDQKPLQRQTRDDDEKAEEKPIVAPSVQRQLQDEDEELATKLDPAAVVQRMCDECEHEKQSEVAQRKEATHQAQASPDLQQRLDNSKGTGRALPGETRSFFESALGADLGNVQVHTGGDAVELNKELGAHAFTHGSHIYFNAGKYDPGSSSGKRLLAHELTHTVQQGGAVRTQKEPEADANVSLKTNSPAIHGDWYNFNIPFTDYQFDPSLEGIKTAAGLVKDTAVAGVEWIVDEIKSLVNSGIEWLNDKWNSLKEFASSSWETLKTAFTDIVSLIKAPLNIISAAILNFDPDSLRAAWAGFSAFVSTIGTGFKAAADKLFQQVDEIWGGISGFAQRLLDKVTGLTQHFLFDKLPDALQQIAFAVVNQLKSLWKSISDSFNNLIEKVRTWVNSAIDTVVNFVNRITSFAIEVVIAGIIQFGKLILFLKDLFANPMKYLKILANKSVEVFDGLENRFAGMVSQYFGDEKQPSATTAATSAVTGVVQRTPDPAAAPETKDSASWGDIGSGVLKAMGEKWEEFKKNPLSLVFTLLLDMFVPIYGTVNDIIELFTEIKNIVTGPLGASSLEEFWTSLLLILDIPILIYQKVVSILMRHLMLPLIVASFIRHPLVTAIASAVGYGLLGMFVEAELLNVGHKILLLKTGATTKAQKQHAYNRIADTLIAMIMTAAIMLVMIILHFIANVMKGIYNVVKGKIVNVETPKVEAKGGGPEGKGGGEGGEGKTGEGRTGKELPTEDNRRIKMNEEGRCEVCASPCEELRKKYKDVMTPEIDGKIKAIEGDPSLTETQQLEKLKPIEKELADLKKGLAPGEVDSGVDITQEAKEGRLKPDQDKWKHANNWQKWANQGGKIIEYADGSFDLIDVDGTKVRYSPEGYPDFSPHLDHPSGVKQVDIDKFDPKRTPDYKKANQKAGHPEWGDKPPADYRWHHHQNGKTMQLVPERIHTRFRHAGGVSLLP